MYLYWSQCLCGLESYWATLLMRLKLISCNYYRNHQKRFELVAKKHLPWYLEAILTCRIYDAWIVSLARIEKVFSNEQQWQSPVFLLSRRLQDWIHGRTKPAKLKQPRRAHPWTLWRVFAKPKVQLLAKHRFFLSYDHLRSISQSSFTN